MERRTKVVFRVSVASKLVNSRKSPVNFEKRAEMQTLTS